MPEDRSEVPEADALEQRLQVTADDEEGEDAEPPTIGSGVSEADALDQARPVPADDEYEHPG